MAGPTWRELERGTRLIADLATVGLQAGERERVMLEGITDLVGARVGLFFRGHVVKGATPLRVVSCHQRGMDETQLDLLARFVAENGQDDPLIKPCMQVKHGAPEAFLRQEVLSDVAFHRHAHFEICREADVDSRLLVTVRLPGTRVYNMTLHRALGERPFAERHRKLLQAIGPALMTLMKWPGLPSGGLLRETDGTILDLSQVSGADLVEHLGFTPRELEVAQHVCQGRSNKQIATELGISPETAKRHVSHLLRKARAESRGELAHALRELDG